MVLEASMRAAAGMTAVVEQVPEGTRVTLRPQGAGRWAGIAFLAVWLAAWACGELFALGALLALAGAGVGMVHSVSVPSGTAGLGIGAFLLVWLSFWTVGGMAAAHTLFRSGWGRNVLTLGQEHWLLWHGVGRWGRSRMLDPAAIRRVILQRGEAVLVVETGGESVSVTTLGAAADRRWLRDALRRSAGLDDLNGPSPQAARRPSVVDPTEALSGYRIDRLRDGTTCVSATARRRAVGAVVLLLLSLFWNGIVGVFVMAGLGLLPVTNGESGGSLSGAMAPGAWGYWLFLTPFILVGLGFIGALAWAAFGREEWWVAPGQMTIRRFFLGNRWSWRLAAAELALTVSADSDGDETWRLLLKKSGKPRVLDSGDPARLRALGLLLAERTGWPLSEPAGR